MCVLSNLQVLSINLKITSSPAVGLDVTLKIGEENSLMIWLKLVFLLIHFSWFERPEEGNIPGSLWGKFGAETVIYYMRIPVQSPINRGASR